MSTPEERSESAENRPIIEIRGLGKWFDTKNGRIDALRDINLSIEKGEIFGIIGRSGAGKSTLVRCINMLERPTEGKVYFEGRDMGALSQGQLNIVRRSMGMIFQQFNLLMQRNALDNVCFPMELAGVSRAKARKKAAEMLELVGLEKRASAYPSQLSGGQKQRVAIARALSTEPRVLLCDEATSALDPETTDSILGLIRDINKRLGITAVVITHEMDVIEKICSKVAIISKGVIAETGTVNEVFFHPRSEIARRLVVPEALHPDKMKLPKLYRLIFDGQSSFDPVVSNMVLACGKPVNIMYASTQDIGGTAFGQMVLQLPEDEESIARIQAYVKEHGLYLEEFTHA
ncbi:MAG: ATP-binding cassette domain-containing protein [Desulfovibrio sp.]|mgnify:FL=1|nr:ATP-binding cassette domain-containing protein [Desulfovibrio sp.]MDD7477163.1 ATP-binding cassette domain-containing protein [Desulfovibrio sp.]MDY5486035.1 ATP-binding cassette domain-containing protein [Desulfovibrio sp.]MEE0406142.1 ATP-binding cassette domain-containing protein [Desulfovibrio sp.]